MYCVIEKFIRGLGSLLAAYVSQTDGIATISYYFSVIFTIAIITAKEIMLTLIKLLGVALREELLTADYCLFLPLSLRINQRAIQIAAAM